MGTLTSGTWRSRAGMLQDAWKGHRGCKLQAGKAGAQRWVIHIPMYSRLAWKSSHAGAFLPKEKAPGTAATQSIVFESSSCGIWGLQKNNYLRKINYNLKEEDGPGGMDAVIALKPSCNRNTGKPRAQVLMDVRSWQRNFQGKDQQRECCNSAFFVKKPKQNKTTQNMEQPKHWTDLLNHRHKRIKKYYQKKKKIHCKRHLVVQGHWIQELLADQPSVSRILCCQEHKRWEYTALTGEELRLKGIYPFQINSVIYSNI